MPPEVYRVVRRRRSSDGPPDGAAAPAPPGAPAPPAAEPPAAPAAPEGARSGRNGRASEPTEPAPPRRRAPGSRLRVGTEGERTTRRGALVGDRRVRIVRPRL